MIHQPTNSRGNYNYNAYVYDNVIWDMHFHRNYELICALEGNNTVICGGNSFILQPKEFLLVPPNVPHFLEIKKDTKMWVCVFSDDFITGFYNKTRGKLFDKFFCEDKVFDFLQSYLLYQGTPSHYMIKACMFAVCDAIEKGAKILSENSDSDRINQIMRYVADNFTRDISLKEAARELRYDYCYLSKIFHRDFGMNFKEYVNIFRFEKACELLASTDSSLTDIALESGFQSVRSFNRVFKALCGKTPNEFKKT